jgi:predicted dehydrogenase
MSHTLRIGIAGARGIGKHHAKWFTRAGCEVVAVYGTTEDSAGAAAAALKEIFGFSGRAFHDWGRFRTEGGFDACSVCSPAESHWANVRDLAADGKHILCEKPLVWNWDYTPLQIVEEATAVVEAAAHHGVLLGVNAQYPALYEGWLDLHQRSLGRYPEYRSLTFVMETKGPPRSPHGAAEVWVDLGPHPLAFIDALMPGGVDWETLRHADGPREAVLDFEWVASERRLPVHIECRRTTDGSMRRLLGNQDLVVQYDGCNVDGDFCTRLRASGHEWIGKDLMRISVERFVEAVRAGDESRLLVNGIGALRQQEALVGVWEHCWERRRDT